MPMYMDIHEVSGATAEDVARAHDADVATQAKYGVEYHKYWFNESRGKIFCLCSAPSSEAAVTVHREAHGLVASKIIEVAPEVAEGFLGGGEVNAGGAALVPGGAAAGEPVENHLDLFGSTVQLAARLCSHAQPEQSLVSNAVAELCIGKGLTFRDLGEVSLKGFDRPVRVHAVQHDGKSGSN
jgi:class 3 adenylate cyclase